MPAVNIRQLSPKVTTGQSFGHSWIMNRVELMLPKSFVTRINAHRLSCKVADVILLNKFHYRNLFNFWRLRTLIWPACRCWVGRLSCWFRIHRKSNPSWFRITRNCSLHWCCCMVMVLSLRLWFWCFTGAPDKRVTTNNKVNSIASSSDQWNHLTTVKVFCSDWIHLKQEMVITAYSISY